MGVYILTPWIGTLALNKTVENLPEINYSNCSEVWIFNLMSIFFSLDVLIDYTELVLSKYIPFCEMKIIHMYKVDIFIYELR